MNCMTWSFSLTLAKQTHLAHSFPHTRLPHTCVVLHLKYPWWCKGGRICGNTRCTSLAYVGWDTPRRIYGFGEGNWWYGGTKTIIPPNILHSNHKLRFHFGQWGYSITSTQSTIDYNTWEPNIGITITKDEMFTTWWLGPSMVN